MLCGLNITANEDKTILFVVVGARRIPQLKSLVLDIDSDNEAKCLAWLHIS